MNRYYVCIEAVYHFMIAKIFTILLLASSMQLQAQAGTYVYELNALQNLLTEDVKAIVPRILLILLVLRPINVF